jgi:hypothetical protein
MLEPNKSGDFSKTQTYGYKKTRKTQFLSILKKKKNQLINLTRKKEASN